MVDSDSVCNSDQGAIIGVQIGDNKRSIEQKNRINEVRLSALLRHTVGHVFEVEYGQPPVSSTRSGIY